MANVLVLNSYNYDRTEAPEREPILIDVGVDRHLNYDRVGANIAVTEPIGLTKQYLSEMSDRQFNSALVTYENLVSNTSQYARTGFDSFAGIGDITKDEWLESEVIEWLVPEVSAIEITDPFKLLPAVVRMNAYADQISAEYEVLNTSTAQNIVEYLITNNGAGVFDFADGTVQVRSLDFSALTQILAKPARTVNVRLKNIVGSGNTWPKIIVTGPITNIGSHIRIFGRYLGAGGGVPVALGADPADQATKLAQAWNNAGLSCSMITAVGSGHTASVQAVAVGNTVEFRITDEDTNAAYNNPIYGDFYNSGGMTGVAMVGNISQGAYQVFMGRNTRKKTWNLSVGTQDTLVVTIAAHGPRPGTVSVFSYDVRSKRATKRGQIPQTTVNGLKEQLDSLAQRLKNKGF